MMRVYEREVDLVLLEMFRSDLCFVNTFLRSIGESPTDSVPNVRGQERHMSDTGTIDISLRFGGRAVFLIENKIDAGYSVTRTLAGQPERYLRSVEALRQRGTKAGSVLLAPEQYLATTRSAEAFDHQVSYEMLRDALAGDALELIDRAIVQAATPYEPHPNSRTMDFFSNLEAFVRRRYPSLVLKRGPNAGSVRPTASRTIYFDVGGTLRLHHDVPKPRMSLQCWDSSAPSASVKIMIGNWATFAERLSVPPTLDDIGAYLRPAGRSLGVVVDTPRLDTQRPFDEQIEEVATGMEGAARLQHWWATNARTLHEWAIVAARGATP